MAEPASLGDDGERGGAVVAFVFVSVLVVVLLLAVLQVAVYVHVRNVVTASAQEGARFAANADVPSSAGADRTVAVVARTTSQQTADGLVCSSVEETDPSGLTLVVVRCSGRCRRCWPGWARCCRWRSPAGRWRRPREVAAGAAGSPGR